MKNEKGKEKEQRARVLRIWNQITGLTETDAQVLCVPHQYVDIGTGIGELKNVGFERLSKEHEK